MALDTKRKRELSPDDLIEGAKSFEHWFEENWKGVAVAIGVIVAAVLLFFAFRSWNESRVNATRSLLDAGLTNFRSAGQPGSDVSGELGTALDKFQQASKGSGGPAIAGRFYEGLTLMRLGRAADAVAPLQDVADHAGDALLAHDARTALAQALIAADRKDEALSILTDLSQGDDAYAAQALLTLGKMAESEGKLEDALAAYRNLSERFPETPLGVQGQQEESRLSAVSGES